MCGQKKRPPEGGNLQTVRVGLAPENDSGIIISQIREKRKPQFSPGRRCPPVTEWGLVLVTIGAGWLVRQLFRLIDKIEG